MYLDALMASYPMPRAYCLWQLPFSAGAKLCRAAALRAGADLRDRRLEFVSDAVDRVLARYGWKALQEATDGR